MAYQPKITVGASVVLTDGRAGEIVEVTPDRPTESSHEEDMTVRVRLDSGEETTVSPGDIEELTPPTGAEPER